MNINYNKLSFLSDIMKILLFSIYFFLIYIKLAYSYLDPGSSSYILQLIVGALVGFFVTLKIYWLKFKNFFFKITKSNKKKNVNDDKNN